MARGHDVTVYCRTPNREDRQDSYLGMRLVHLPALNHKVAETLSHTTLSVAHAVSTARPDAAVVFNAANASVLPALRARGIPVATHVDGLEWQRSKWGPVGQRYYRWAEAMAVRWSDALIADARGIADYYSIEFGAPTRIINYGAPRVTQQPNAAFAESGLSTGGYHLAVARFEPENKLHTLVAGYVASNATRPLVLVGSAPYADGYIRRVRDLADHRVVFLGSVWDQGYLDQLYARAYVYWHGHSVGGTNPSLLRALGASAPSIAHDNVFNREVLGSAGRFFGDPSQVTKLLEDAESDVATNESYGAAAGRRAIAFDWDEVATDYETLCADLMHGRLRALGLSGHRGEQWAATAGV